MMRRKTSPLLFAALAVGCMGNEGRSFRDVVQIVRTCLDAQIRIGNPWFDAASGMSGDPRVNTAIFRDIPNASMYIVKLGVSPSYPDAPIAMCYFDHSDTVTRALFPDSRQNAEAKRRDLPQQSMFENASEEQANEYLLQTRYETLRLSDVLGTD